MRIEKVVISLKIQEKIFKKHNIKREEIESIFFNDPIYFKAKGGRYIAIGFAEKHITIVFSYNNKIAEVITAYESSKWQKELYRKKK